MTTSFINLFLTSYIITETSARRISNVSAAYASIVKRNTCKWAQEDDILKVWTLFYMAQFSIFLKIKPLSGSWRLCCEGFYFYDWRCSYRAFPMTLLVLLMLYLLSLSLAQTWAAWFVRLSGDPMLQSILWWSTKILSWAHPVVAIDMSV